MGFSDRATAEQKGRVMQSLMRVPSAWTIVVWENSGWHVKLTCGGMSLRCEGNPILGQGVWWTLMSGDGVPGGGSCYWTPGHIEFDDPNDAVDYQLNLCQQFMDRCQQSVSFVRNAIAPKPAPKKKATA